MIVLVFLGLSEPLQVPAPQSGSSPSPCDALVTVQNKASALGPATCKLIASGQLPDSRWPNFSKYRELLNKFYAPDYTPAWSDSGQPTPQARLLIDLFQHAEQKGLTPEDYDAERWDARLQRLSRPEATPEDVAVFDVALTVSAMRYIADLYLGRVSPRDANFGLPAKRLETAEFLRNKVLHSGDVITAVQQLEPPFAKYRQMLKALQTYMDLERQEPAADQQPLPAVSKPISPGKTYAGAAQLAQKLRQLGDLSADAQLAPQPDLYAGALVAAVQRFQQRHGLNDDGRLTAETIRELNVPLSVRITQMRLNLERWRWLPAGIPSPLVVVNIPEFKLRAYADHQPAFTSRVIVGKAFNHKTPLFADEMEFIIFRPYWNVPPSITRDEILPALRRDSGYLSKHEMEIVNAQGQIITAGAPDANTMRQLRAGRFEVRQRPGIANSLGLVKFVFPNQYSVYLHGTPERQLFTRARRDFSHGCIRVEDPEGLAGWALANDASWTRERIRAVMLGDRTIQVNLPQHIPVLIFYSTAIIGDNGEPRFFPDVYGLDAALQSILGNAPR